MLAQYRKVYLAREHSLTKVYPGVVEGLAVLGGRKGTATTKGSPTTRAILEQFGLIQHFDHVQGTDGFPCKPAPDVLFTALAAMGAEPEDCLFVGDSAADMEAGRRAGVATCAVDLRVWEAGRPGTVHAGLLDRRPARTYGAGGIDLGGVRICCEGWQSNSTTSSSVSAGAPRRQSC